MPSSPELSLGARLVGKKGLVLLVAASVGGLVLATVEMAVGVGLQMFLHASGLTAGVAATSRLAHVTLTIAQASVALVVLAVVRAAAQLALSQAALRLHDGTLARLRVVAVYGVLDGEVADASAASLQVALSETFVRGGLFVQQVSTLVASFLQAALLAAFLLLIAWREALVAFAGVAVVAVVLAMVVRRARSAGHGLASDARRIQEVVVRVTRNLLLIRVLRTAAVERARVARAVHGYATAQARVMLLSGIVWAATPFAGLLVVGIVVVSSRLSFHAPAATLLALLYVFVRWVQSLATMAQTAPQVIHNRAAFVETCATVQRIPAPVVTAALEAVESPPELPSPGSTSPPARIAPPEIVLDGVHFAYGDHVVLERLSLAVPRGARVGITGPSGVGKSTLLEIVLGVLAPARGEVRLDGAAPRDYFARADVRVGYVGADAFVVAGTVRDNLLYGTTWRPDDAALWSALARARLDAEIAKLARGLDHPLAEGGAGLSTGQKQRLALARAFVASPALLVLDEATANVDLATERAIADAIADVPDVTCLVVSHRPALLAHCTAVHDLGAIASPAAAAAARPEAESADIGPGESAPRRTVRARTG